MDFSPHFFEKDDPKFGTIRFSKSYLISIPFTWYIIIDDDCHSDSILEKVGSIYPLIIGLGGTE